MKISDDIVQQVVNMDLKQTYQFYLTCKEEAPALGDVYDKVRFGITMKFDIHDVFDEYVLPKPNNEIVRCRGKTIGTLVDYRTELERRNAMLKKAVLDHITEKNEHWKPMEEKAN